MRERFVRFLLLHLESEQFFCELKAQLHFFVLLVPWWLYKLVNFQRRGDLLLELAASLNIF